jgi:hypothetical protein
MVDPLVGAAASEVVKAGGGVLTRLLGPTADLMGDQLQQWYGGKYVGRVARRAEQKANTGTAGSIPMRVAAEVFEKAQWAEDEFVAEYLSGVLATARTPEGRDDRAISWTALVGRLSADQLRLHYILYRGIRLLSMHQEWDALSSAFEESVVLGYSELLPALGIPSDDEGVARLLDAVYGLSAEGLIAEYLSHGGPEYMEKNKPNHNFPKDVGDLLLVKGTTRGAALFLQAHGLGKEWAGALLDPDENLVLEWPEGTDVPLVNMARMSTYKIDPDGPSW